MENETDLVNMGWNDISSSAGRRTGESPPRDRVRELVRQIVDVVHWHSTYANARCPLGHAARLFLDGPLPYLNCLHEACTNDVAEINAEIRERFQDAGIAAQFQRDPEEEALRKKLRLTKAYAQNQLLPMLLKMPPITLEHWQRISPVPVADHPVHDHWRLFLRLYWPGDLLWCGELFETSKPEFAYSFKTRRQWLERRRTCPGPQICQVPFVVERSGKSLWIECSRSREWCYAHAPYIVVEHDDIRQEQFGNVIVHLQRILKLRALVDTGGKSLHAWFDHPRQPAREYTFLAGRDRERFVRSADPQERLRIRRTDRAADLYPERMAALKALLTGLGCDPKMLRHGATARLPGCEREETGRWQRLLYLDDPQLK